MEKFASGVEEEERDREIQKILNDEMNITEY